MARTQAMRPGHWGWALAGALALSGCLAPERSDAELQQALAGHSDVSQDTGAEVSQGMDTAVESDAADSADLDTPAADVADSAELDTPAADVADSADLDTSDADVADSAADTLVGDAANAGADGQDGAGPDAGPDVAKDVAPDVAKDAAPEVVADAAADAGPDSAADVAPDVAKDAAPEVVADAAADAGPDSAADVAPDVAKDAAPEVVADAAADTTAPPPCQPGFVAIAVDGQLVCAADVPLWGVKPLKQEGSFTANGDGTVSDAKSLLMWQASGAATAYTHAEAEAQCQAATTGGHSDWRLPTVAEWLSIIDYSQLFPALTKEFSVSIYTGFWAANANAGQVNTHWYVWLNYGYTTTSAPGTKEHVLCVRCTTANCAHPAAAKAGATRFSEQFFGAAVTDALTGLTWQVNAGVNGTVTWAEASGVCQALAIAGGGWRVPNVAELLTIVHRSSSAPAIDTAVFPGTKSEWYWTSTPWGGSDNTEAWFVQFGSGESNHYPKSNKHRLRCVK